MEKCEECKNYNCENMREMKKTREAIKQVGYLSKAYFQVTIKCDYFVIDESKIKKCCCGS